ncbi:MAG: hypothetical protein JEZ11_24555 [Desulfobacterales bacterium]|nr:hypothetical protein [Desulfobacterales bacterium]
MEKITGSQGLLELFKNASRDRFWGSISFGFQNGKLTMVRKEETRKVDSIDFGPNNIDSTGSGTV